MYHGYICVVFIYISRVAYGTLASFATSKIAFVIYYIVFDVEMRKQIGRAHV